MTRWLATLGMLIAKFALCALSGVTACAQSTGWTLQEIFTDSTGNVQFIELVTTEPNQFQVNNQVLTVVADGVPSTFTLNHNLTGQASTAGRSFLLATTGFTALAGSVTPDFIIPANFINPAAFDLITFDFAGVDSLMLPPVAIPTDGINSLVDHTPDELPHLLNELNSPTNFAGAMGVINASGALLPADFDSSGTVNNVDLAFWRFGYGKKPGASERFDGDANNDGHVNGFDLMIWQREAVAIPALPAGVPTPEPTGAALAAALLAFSGATLRRRQA